MRSCRSGRDTEAFLAYRGLLQDLDGVYNRKARPGATPLDRGLDPIGFSLEGCLNAAIGKVSNPPGKTK